MGGLVDSGGLGGFQEKANCPLNDPLNLTHYLTSPLATGKKYYVRINIVLCCIYENMLSLTKMSVKCISKLISLALYFSKKCIDISFKL